MKNGRSISSESAFGIAARTLLLLLLTLLLVLSELPFAAASAQAKSFDLRRFLESAADTKTPDGHGMGLKLAPPGDYRKVERSFGFSRGMPLAASVDLTDDLPPVGDQGYQGSCAAWATSYYYKTFSEKQEHTGWNLDDARYQFSPSFVYNQINGGVDAGASFPEAFSLLETKGDVDIAEMPYDDSDWTTQPTASQLEAAKPYRIPPYSQSGWGCFFLHEDIGPYTTPNDIFNLKAWLDNGEMLVMAIPIYFDFPDFFVEANPYYVYDGSSSLLDGHGVAIVGYDDNANPSGSDADHRGGFKMVNSWGPGWNGGGTLYLSYDFVKRYVWEAWAMCDLPDDSPRIDSLDSSSGEAGQQVRISGDNFGTNRRSARVSFNGVDSTEAFFTNSMVTATVPEGATSGPLTVYNWDGEPSNAVTFTVEGSEPTPNISRISPARGRKGTRVTIIGSGFGATKGSSKVMFGSTACAGRDYLHWSNERIVVKTPTDASGKCKITIRTAAGTSNGRYYKVRPLISTMSPTSGKRGSLVTIRGYGFGSFQSGYTVVYFNGVRSISYVTWSDRKIQARVPQKAKGTGKIVVKTAGGVSWGKSFTVVNNSRALFTSTVLNALLDSLRSVGVNYRRAMLLKEARVH